MENTLLNLIPSSYIPEVHLSQYDKGRELTFKLMDGNAKYSIPSGATITVKATKPSGLGFDVAGTFTGNVVTIVNTETMSNEAGRFRAELSIVSGETLLGTSNFIFNVERSPHPDGTVDGDAEALLPELTLLVERIETAADSIHTLTVEAEGSATPSATYDSTTNKITFGIPTGDTTKADAIVETASGNIASFNDGGDGLAIKSLKVNIEPKQSGSGDPSPSNVRPISGWNEVNANVVGANLLDPTYRYDTSASGNYHIRYYWNGGSTTYSEKLRVKSGVAYTLSYDGTNASGIYIRKSTSQNIVVKYNSNTVTFTPTEDCWLAVDIYWSNEPTGGVASINPILSVGSTATDYEPYTAPTETTTTLPSTVYGGTLDVVSGELTLTWASKLVNSVTWYYVAPNSTWTKGLFYTEGFLNQKKNGITNLMCERYKTLRNAVDDYLIFGNDPNGYVYIVDTTYSSVSAMVSAIGTMPIFYQLATPTTYQLTPTEVLSLLGSNNIWSDSGTVEVEYRADTTLAFENLKNAIISLGGNI